LGLWPQISTGVTLRENNLKEIEGGKILESQGVLVANRRALQRDPRLMKVVHELIERFEVRSRTHRTPRFWQEHDICQCMLPHFLPQ